MGHPPHGQKDDEQPAIKMISPLKLAALNHASSALAILKGGFYPHTPLLLAHALRRGWPIGDQKPGFLISGLPTGTERARKLMLLPEQNVSIPGLAWLADHLLALLPVSIAVSKAPSASFLIFDAQHVMPPNPLTELNQGQAGQSAISQQGALIAAEMRSQQIKKVPNDLPLSLIPGFLLRHDAPGDWQHARLHQDAQIDNGRFFGVGRQIQDQGDRLVVPIG